MFYYPLVAKLIDFLNQTIQKLTVVRYDNNRSVEIFQGILQDIFRAHIQMVGRLVEDKQIDWFKKQTDHRQTTALTSRQDRNFLFGCFSTKHESSQNIPYLRPDISLGHIIDCIKYRHIIIKQLRLVLCKITYLDTMSQLQRALKRNLIHDTLYQGRFTFTVFTDECHFFSSLDRQIDMFENQMISITL